MAHPTHLLIRIGRLFTIRSETKTEDRTEDRLPRLLTPEPATTQVSHGATDRDQPRTRSAAWGVFNHPPASDRLLVFVDTIFKRKTLLQSRIQDISRHLD